MLRMDDREELRRLIDVLEKGSGSSSLEQAIDDDPKDYTIHKKQETRSHRSSWWMV